MSLPFNIIIVFFFVVVVIVLTECKALGVADINKIPDESITASTFYFLFDSPFCGRLEETRGDGAWCPKTRDHKEDYLQVDMGEVYSVCEVATQGQRTGDFWTISYKLQFSLDGETYDFYKELNNTVKVRRLTRLRLGGGVGWGRGGGQGRKEALYFHHLHRLAPADCITSITLSAFNQYSLNFVPVPTTVNNL